MDVGGTSVSIFIAKTTLISSTAKIVARSSGSLQRLFGRSYKKGRGSKFGKYAATLII